MEITRMNLLKQLINAITDDEWIQLAQNGLPSISEFNRSVLLEMKTTDAVNGPDVIKEADLTGLYKAVKDYLEVHLSDKPDDWKSMRS